MNRIFFFLLFVAGSLSAAEAPRARLVLTAQENGTEPQSEFLCQGTIHGYIRLPKTEVGEHRLEALWFGPDGKKAAHSRDTVNFAPPGRSTAYIWFSFPERSPMSGRLDPEEDTSKAASQGTWQVKALWDGRPLVASSFTVRCY